MKMPSSCPDSQNSSLRIRDNRKSRPQSLLLPIAEESRHTKSSSIGNRKNDQTANGEYQDDVVDKLPGLSNVYTISERDLPEIVAQLQSLGTTKPRKDVAIEDALVPLNALIMRKELEELRCQMLRSAPTPSLYDSPCPSSKDFLRRKTENKLRASQSSTIHCTNRALETSARSTEIHDSAIESLSTRRRRTSSTVFSVMAPISCTAIVSPLKIRKRLSQGSGSTLQSTTSHMTSSSVYSSQSLRVHDLRPLTALSETVDQINQAIVDGFGHERGVSINEKATESKASSSYADSTLRTSTSSKRFGILFESLSYEPLELQLLKGVELDDKPARPLLADYAFAREDFIHNDGFTVSK